MKKLHIYYIPDLDDMYDDTNMQQEGFATRDGHVLADPKVYPPFAYGCKFEVKEQEPSDGELLYKEEAFSVYTWNNNVQVITIIPNNIDIEIVNSSLNTEEKQRGFFKNKDKYIEEWRK